MPDLSTLTPRPLLAVALAALLGLAGCGAPQDDDALIRPEPRELAGELLDSAAVDLEDDGVPERVELRARVERDDRGRLMWDDGQEWSLVVDDEEGVYTLFEGWVQLGTLGFWLLESGGDTPVSIVSLENAGSGVRVRRYDWLPDERAFRQVDALEAHGNMVHRPQEPS